MALAFNVEDVVVLYRNLLNIEGLLAFDFTDALPFHLMKHFSILCLILVCIGFLKALMGADMGFIKSHSLKSITNSILVSVL